MHRCVHTTIIIFLDKSLDNCRYLQRSRTSSIAKIKVQCILWRTQPFREFGYVCALRYHCHRARTGDRVRTKGNFDSSQHEQCLWDRDFIADCIVANEPFVLEHFTGDIFPTRPNLFRIRSCKWLKVVLTFNPCAPLDLAGTSGFRELWAICASSDLERELDWALFHGMLYHSPSHTNTRWECGSLHADGIGG